MARARSTAILKTLQPRLALIARDLFGIQLGCMLAISRHVATYRKGGSDSAMHYEDYVSIGRSAREKDQIMKRVCI